MLSEMGSGPPLVFLPGFDGTGQSFQSQVEYFSKDFRTLAWTMPGYAGTPALDLVSVGGLALALLAELDSLNLGAVHLVGHAIGGMVVQEIATRAPERVLSAVLLASWPSLGEQDGEFRLQFMEQRMAPIDAGLTMADVAPVMMTTLVSPHADPNGVRVAIDALASAPTAVYKSMLQAAAQFDRRDDLQQMMMPTLCIAGEVDRQAPSLMMERMAEKLPDGRFALIRRAGHEAQLEQARAFNAILGAFLADLQAEAA